MRDCVWKMRNQTGCSTEDVLTDRPCSWFGEGSGGSNRKRGAVAVVQLWALQAVPEVWLSAQSSAQEAAIYLNKTWGVIAFSSVNVLF